MKELLPDIERWRDAGKKVAIATVVQAYGSAPRRPNAWRPAHDAARHRESYPLRSSWDLASSNR